MLNIDLMRLGSPEKFQLLCSRLAIREFPDAIPLNFASWDGGRDILLRLASFDDGTIEHDIVWQAKFTDRPNTKSTKNSIQDSITAISNEPNTEVRKWILCIPVDPTLPFLKWLEKELPPTWELGIWGKTKLIELLEKHSDIAQTFFYPVYDELRQIFGVEKLELEQFRLDPLCEWEQPDSKLLYYSTSKNVASPDFVLDIIVKNAGETDALLQAIEVEFTEWRIKMHGIPEDGLLLPKIEYKISINGGQPGIYRVDCFERPLIIPAKKFERFKICLCDTGYAWCGTIVITLDYGKEKRLQLPALRLHT